MPFSLDQVLVLQWVSIHRYILWPNILNTVTYAKYETVNDNWCNTTSGKIKAVTVQACFFIFESWYQDFELPIFFVWKCDHMNYKFFPTWLKCLLRLHVTFPKINVTHFYYTEETNILLLLIDNLSNNTIIIIESQESNIPATVFVFITKKSVIKLLRLTLRLKFFLY